MYQKIFNLLNTEKNVHSDYTCQNTVEKNDSELCYIRIYAPPRFDFDIQGFFNGNLDNSFKDKSGSGQPSVYFDGRCHIYRDINDLFTNSKLKLVERGSAEKGMYILVSPYSKDEIKKFAAEGSFSRAIKKAIDYRSALKHRDKISVVDPRFQNIIPEIINNNFTEKYNHCETINLSNRQSQLVNHQSSQKTVTNGTAAGYSRDSEAEQLRKSALQHGGSPDIYELLMGVTGSPLSASN